MVSLDKEFVGKEKDFRCCKKTEENIIGTIESYYARTLGHLTGGQLLIGPDIP
jgi:hypothetical protein